MFFDHKTLIIIPVYNAQNQIVKLINELKLVNATINYLIIDDHSTDNTLLVCQQKNFNIIALSNHWGLDNAIATGYQYALDHDFDYVVTFLGDHNFKANNIKIMTNEINNRYDVVIGNQYAMPHFTSKISVWEKMLAFMLTKKNSWIINNPESRINLVSKEVIEIIFYHKAQRLDSLMLEKLIKKEFKIKEVKLTGGQQSLRKNRYYYPVVTFWYWLMIIKKRILKF